MLFFCSTDLIIMSEIIQKMAGIEINEELTEDQVDALCGGEILRSEFGSFQTQSQQAASGVGSSTASAAIQATAPAGQSWPGSQSKSAQKKTLAKLKEILIDQDLLVPFMILLSQHRDIQLYSNVADRSQLLHVKLLGRLYDHCQDTLVHCASFAHQQIGVEELQKSGRLPGLPELIHDFSVVPEVAFHFQRPLIDHNISVCPLFILFLILRYL